MFSSSFFMKPSGYLAESNEISMFDYKNQCHCIKLGAMVGMDMYDGMDHSEECDEQLVNTEKRIAVSTTKTDSHRTALLRLVPLAFHQQRVVDHLALLAQRESR